MLTQICLCIVMSSSQLGYPKLLGGVGIEKLDIIPSMFVSFVILYIR